MLNAEGRVETDRASRYLAQLGQHADHMGQHAGHRPHPHRGSDAAPQVDHAEWSDTCGTIKFPWGQCILQATSDALTLRVEATDEEHLRRIQDGIGRRIETIGRRDRLTVNWHEPLPTQGGGEPGVEY